MELFKIREGPWKRLFEGVFQEYEIAIYSNPDSVLMVLIIDKKDGKIVGSVLELYKMFYASGDIEQFVSTLPRDIILIQKHQENVNQKFLLLAGKPVYVNWVEKEFQNTTDELLKKISVSSKMIKDISKAYDLELIEMLEAPLDVKNSFFSEPLMVPISTTASRINKKISEHEEQLVKEIMLGKTREGKIIEEPIEFINTSIITGGMEPDRKTMMQVLLEGMLLNKIPAIIFDYNNEFVGLGTPNNSIELKEFNQEPIGFPVKRFNPGENLFIDLKLFNSEGLIEFIGAGDNKPSQTISTLIELTEFNNIKELIQTIKNEEPSEQFSEYEIHKAKRILQVIELHYSKLLSQKNSFNELTENQIKGIGKASLLELKTIEEKKQFLITYSVVKLVLETLKKIGKTNQTKLVIAIPSSEKIIPKENPNLLQQELNNIILELTEYGCGVILETPILTELSTQTIEKTKSTFTIIRGKDVGVQLKNKKSYRIILKPSLSKN